MAGAMSRVKRVRSLGINVKKMMYESIVVPTVLYGAETWGLNEKEIKCNRNEMFAKYMWCDS